MRKLLLLPCVLLACTVTLPAQSPSSKPLTAADLLRSEEGVSVGEPIRRATRASPAAAAAEEPATARGERPATAASTPKLTGQTEITSNEATFDQKSHQAVFSTNVTVKNPEFTLTSEKLTAFLKHAGSKSKAPAGAAPAATPAAGGTAKKGGKRDSGGLERAIAEGNVVIIQDKQDSGGNPVRSVGRARRAVYDATNGDITLSGRPEVSQGINTLIATDDSTVIIMNAEEQTAKANGPSKTVIRDSGPDSASNGR